MASRFEINDEKYIEELKGKCENENTKNSTEWWKNVFKSGRKQDTCKQISLQISLIVSRERCSWLTIVAVLSIQKFSNFTLYVINK